MPGYPFRSKGRLEGVSPGQRFGQLTILDIIPAQEREDAGAKPGRSFIRLRCDCGNLVQTEARYLIPGNEARRAKTNCGLACKLLEKPDTSRQCRVCRIQFWPAKNSGRPPAWCSPECKRVGRRKCHRGDPEYFTVGRGPGIPSRGNGRIGVSALREEPDDEPEPGVVRYLVVTRDEETEHDSYLEAASEFRIRTGRAAA